MIVTIIKDDEGNSIGWEMSGENLEEIKKLGVIRDLQFWGINDYAIEYNGRRLSNDATGNPGTLMWQQKKFIKH